MIQSLPAGGEKRAVLYLRQSTYREESISLELQESAAREHARRMGYHVVAVESDPVSPVARGIVLQCNASWA